MARLVAEVVRRSLDVHTPNSGRILNVSTFLPYVEVRNIGDLVVVTYPKSVGGPSAIELYRSDGVQLATTTSRTEVSDLTALATAISADLDSLDSKLVAITADKKLQIFDVNVELSGDDKSFEAILDGSDLSASSKGPYTIPQMRAILGCDAVPGEEDELDSEVYGVVGNKLLRLNAGWIIGDGGGINLAIPTKELDGSSDGKVGLTCLMDYKAELSLPYLLVRSDEKTTYLEAIGPRAPSLGNGTSVLPARIDIDGEGDYDIDNCAT